jgi:isopentenyl-diphosphate Delta-isomerase
VQSCCENAKGTGNTVILMEQEIVDVVNEKDEVTGKATRAEAHQKGLIHRALSVIVLNSKGQILLQQRAEDKQIAPLSYDLSTSEHVLSGESYEEAAKRSLREELGVEGEVKKLRETILQKRRYKVNGKVVLESEQTGLFYTYHEGPFNIDFREVYRVEFFEFKDVKKMVEESPEKVTRWFKEEWERLEKYLKKLLNHKAQS